MENHVVIVAGGQSRRMGTDKTDLVLKGKSFLQHALDLALAFGPDELTVLGRTDTQHGIPDPLPGEGPARNLRAWIEDQAYPFNLLVLPVDMPGLTLKHLRLLAQKSGYFNDQFLPFFATIGKHIESDTYRMTDLLHQLELSPIKPPAEMIPGLKNYNTPQDLGIL